ncbi:Divalent ion tolerance protein, CutA [Cynara cardunculus var. scolymus]|uniref:Divalent ion tolerance protein, CutA n=1 Tax=Cynara cardunculus var. scolymus TaxID=59895 RepID=A0A118K411_CYNCS|nr:Divalent ion tolerance protein, CutA [Cynara cardunculus var. scolymus]
MFFSLHDCIFDYIGPSPKGSLQKIQTDSEELLITKTRKSLLNALTEHVKENHEYK